MLAQGSHLTQPLALIPHKHRRYVSKLLFTLSVWPSIYGWYVVPYFILQPYSLKSSFQNSKVKIRLWSLTMLLGNLCRRYISLMKICVTCWVNGWRRVMKWLYFESWSMMTKVTVWSLILGRPSIKSNDMSSQTHSGMCKGCSSLKGATDSTLLRWQVSHSSTVFFTAFRIPGRQNVAMTRWSFWW